MRAALLAIGLACGLGVLSSPAVAQTDEASKVTARRLAEEAADLYESGDYKAARDLFHRAYKLHPAPTLALWEARSLVKLGRLVEAEERYTTIERYPLDENSPELFHEAVEEASAEVDKLRKRIPTVKIVLGGVAQNDPAVEVRVDDHKLNPAMIGIAVPVNPGKHVIRAFMHGEMRSKVTVSLRERDRRKVKLEVSEVLGPEPAPQPEVPDEPPAPEPGEDVEADEDELDDVETLPDVESEPRGNTMKSLGTITLGLGIVGVTTGVVAGLIAVGKHNTIEENCPNEQCPPPYHDDLDAFRTFRTVSTIGYAVGAGGVVIGTLLLIAAPSDSGVAGSDSFGVWVGLSSAGVSGTF